MALLAAELAEAAPVEVVSLPELLRECAGNGEGKITALSDDCGISSYALGLAGRIRAAGSPVCLVGWSTGGMVAIETAARFPELLAGIVLMSTTARFCSTDGYSMGVAKAELRAMRLGLRKDPPAVLGDFFRRSALPAEIAERNLASKIESAQTSGIDDLLKGLDYLRTTDLREALRSLALPALVIHGKEDRIIPWTAGDYLARNLDHARAVFLPKAGHALPERYTHDAAAHILQFLEKSA